MTHRHHPRYASEGKPPSALWKLSLAMSWHLLASMAARLACDLSPCRRQAHSLSLFCLKLSGTVAAVSQEDGTSDGDAPVTLAGLKMQTDEIPGTTVALAAPPSSTSSARKPTVPAAHRITTVATYGLDRLESEGTWSNVPGVLLAVGTTL